MTGIEKIHILPVGAEILVRPGPEVSIRRRPTADLLYSDESLPVLLDRAEEEIRSNVVALARAGFQSLACDLTGGMDSRLVVAAILKENLQAAFSFTTRGPAQAPDALVASLIRETFGLSKTRKRTRPVPGKRGLAVLRCGLGRTHGMMELPFRFASTPGEMRCTGGLGELMRVFWSNPPEKAPLAALLRRLAQNRGSYISPFAERRLRQMLAEVGQSLLDEGVAHEDLGDAFYLLSRNRYHFGVPWRGSGAQFHPLYSPSAVHAAHRLDREERKRNLIGFSLMHRWSPALARVP